MLVVARILSRPEPPKPTGLMVALVLCLMNMSMMNLNGNVGMNVHVHTQAQAYHYVSKSWFRAALKWLDVQAEERQQREQKWLKLLQRGRRLISPSTIVSISIIRSKRRRPRRKEEKITSFRRNCQRRRLLPLSKPGYYLRSWVFDVYRGEGIACKTASFG